MQKSGPPVYASTLKKKVSLDEAMKTYPDQHFDPTLQAVHVWEQPDGYDWVWGVAIHPQNVSFVCNKWEKDTPGKYVPYIPNKRRPTFAVLNFPDNYE